MERRVKSAAHAAADRRYEYARSALSDAQNDLDKAEREYGEASRALQVFEQYEPRSSAVTVKADDNG